MQEERSGGGYGGGGGNRQGGGRRGGEDSRAQDYKPNTSSTTGWAQFSNKDGPQHNTREKCNLGGYCWTHGSDPLGLKHTSKTCMKK